MMLMVYIPHLYCIVEVICKSNNEYHQSENLMVILASYLSLSISLNSCSMFLIICCLSFSSTKHIHSFDIKMGL
jgi:hypothetical protein